MEKLYEQLNKDYPRYTMPLHEMYYRAISGYIYKRQNTWEHMTFSPPETDQIKYFQQSFERAKEMWDKEPDACPDCLFDGQDCALCNDIKNY